MWLKVQFSYLRLLGGRSYLRLLGERSYCGMASGLLPPTPTPTPAPTPAFTSSTAPSRAYKSSSKSTRCSSVASAAKNWLATRSVFTLAKGARDTKSIYLTPYKT